MKDNPANEDDKQQPHREPNVHKLNRDYDVAYTDTHYVRYVRTVLRDAREEETNGELKRISRVGNGRTKCGASISVARMRINCVRRKPAAS